MNNVPPPPGFTAFEIELPTELRPAPPVPNRVANNPKPIIDKTFEEEMSDICRNTLTPRHAVDHNILGYIRAYMNCRHPGQAAKAVGLTAVEGNNLFKYKDIHEAIRLLTELSAVKFGFGAEEIVERVKEIAFFDPIDLRNADGTWKLPEELEPGARMAIKSAIVSNIMEKDANGIETGRMVGKVIKYEFYDRMDAVKTLGREKNTFKETKKIEHDITSNMKETLLGSARRAEERALQMRDVTGSES